eukprot:1055487-Pleurochrysis_carterae.AAC.3
MASTVRLQEGDVVPVTVSIFGEQYARSRGAMPWTSAIACATRQGKAVGKRNEKWVVKFDVLDDPAVLLRKAIHL